MADRSAISPFLGGVYICVFTRYAYTYIYKTVLSQEPYIKGKRKINTLQLTATPNLILLSLAGSEVSQNQFPHCLVQLQICIIPAVHQSTVLIVLLNLVDFFILTRPQLSGGNFLYELGTSCQRPHTWGWPLNSVCWRRSTGYLTFIGHFPQKRPMISRSFANNDLQLKAS